MTQKILAAALAATLSPSFAHAASYSIDPDHTTVGFKVRHMMVSSTQGRFQKFAGTVRLDDAHPENSQVEVTIEAASVDTGLAKRDEHLRSADFFDAAKHPQITFRSRQVKKAGEGKLELLGDLTIRGITREVVLEVHDLGPEVKDPWGGIRRGATASAKVSRKAYGLNWNAVLESGGVAVGDEVQILLEVELLRKA